MTADKKDARPWVDMTARERRVLIAWIDRRLDTLQRFEQAFEALSFSDGPTTKALEKLDPKQEKEIFLLSCLGGAKQVMEDWLNILHENPSCEYVDGKLVYKGAD
jgi:hypothetical protein